MFEHTDETCQKLKTLLFFQISVFATLLGQPGFSVKFLQNYKLLRLESFTNFAGSNAQPTALIL